MNNRVLSGALAAVLIATTAVTFAFDAGAQTEGGGGDFGSFSLIATAPGFEVTEDEPSAQAHPEGHGAVPYTSTLLSNGFGYGVAALAWPGATAANGGALLALLVPSQVGGVPVPPEVGQAVAPIAPSANYPVKAEARAGTTPDASYTQFPGAVMTAHADDANVTAEGSVQKAEQPGQASFGNTRSNTESVLSGKLGRATATSSAQDIDLGGVVKIKSVTSTATAQTDGVKATGSGGTVVQGMTIAEQPAYVDENGVHIGEQGQPANAVASQIANEALTDGGFEFYVSQPHGEQDGGTGTFNAGSLYVVWEPPGNPSGNVFTMTFGGARVSVSAGEGFGLPEAGATDSAVAAVDIPGVAPGAIGSVGVPTGGSTPPGAVASAPTSTPTERPLGFDLARSFGGFGWGWLVLGVALVALAGAGNRRLLGDLLDRPAVDCPLEHER